ncbi:hypothetical protein RSSM_02311 [Rhodopirellula sallentina SM41]|uniref:Uncharacterized protein n=1 Tax=Rhodopirellula sallentina SM41 TaxID=1263870 RepID=M5UEJ1_9BACT|nr:hypothetical protein RSSM_02311 [Rhodopirellula sallentina SM41]
MQSVGTRFRSPKSGNIGYVVLKMLSNRSENLGEPTDRRKSAPVSRVNRG